MKKLWLRFKAFVAILDFSDAMKDVADDLKKSSVAMFSLWLLSVVSRLPVTLAFLPKFFGIEGVPFQTSEWVTWLLFIAAVALYIAQVVLRIKLRSKPKHDEVSV